MEIHPVASRIESVMVYAEGARVRRLAELDESVSGRIRLTGLPLSLRDDSVRVSVTAANGATPPVAADVRVAVDVPEPDATLRPADDEELRAARLAMARARSDRDCLRRQIALAENLAITSRPLGEDGEPPPPTPTEARLSLLAFRAAREEALRERLAAAVRAVDDAERAVGDLEDRNRRATSARAAREHELRKTLVIALRGEPAACRVAVDYLVPGARWAPAYSVRVDPEAGTAELAMRALVAQRTGEDWRGVPLTLSTAEPLAFTELPELASRRIGRRQPRPPRRGWRPPPTGVEELYVDHDRAFGPPREALERPAPAPPPPPEPADMTAAVTLSGAAMPAQAMAPPPGMMPAAAGVAPQAPARRSRSRKEKKKRDKRAAEPVPEPEMVTRAGGVTFDLDDELAEEGAAMDALEAAPAAPAELRADEDLLDYGSLRMPPASSPRRGHLVRAGRVELYSEVLVMQKVSVAFDVGYVVDAACHRAAEVARRGLARHRPVWSREYDYAYAAEAAVDVPADGEFHAVPVLVRSGAVELRHVVVPREATDVFRRARLDNPLDAPILPGPADVYVRGDFLLTADLDFTPPGGVVELGLGVEQKIKVSRNAAFREESSGLLRGSLQLAHQVDIELRSLLDRRVTVEVRERVPTVRDGEDDIEVDVRTAPPAQDYEPDAANSDGEPTLRGGRLWTVALAPDAPEKLALAYDIKISAKHELVGGNRREE